MILDIHTHHPAPQPQALICTSPMDFTPTDGQFYSLGIHPWDCASITPEALDNLKRLAAHPQVLAIGESGIDVTHLDSAPMFRQLLTFKSQIEISEAAGKPLIIHDVKAHDVILECHKEFAPTQPWIIHGFRGKPSVAKMLLRPGIYFSFGEKFNPDTLRSIPSQIILAETDCSPLAIQTIIDSIADALSFSAADTLSLIADNTARILDISYQTSSKTPTQ